MLLCQSVRLLCQSVSLCLFCESFNSISEAASKIRRSTNEGNVARRAAMHFLKAMDHSLSFVVGGLKVFQSKGTVPVLKPGDMRYAVPRDTLKRPCPWQVPPHVKQLRSCSYNATTEKAEWDLNIATVGKDFFGMVGDEGPRDLPVFWYLPHRQYRCVPMNDPLHRCARDMYESAQMCGLWQIILDTGAVLTYDHGPFLSSHNFQKAVELAENYVMVGSPDDDL